MDTTEQAAEIGYSLMDLGRIVPQSVRTADFEPDSDTTLYRLSLSSGERRRHPALERERKQALPRVRIMGDAIDEGEWVELSEETAELLNQEREGELARQAAGTSPLIQCLLLGGAPAALKQCLQAHGPEVADAAGRTAVHYAVMMNNGKAVRALVKAGADVDAKDARGTPALVMAAQKAHFDALTVLIKAGARVGATDRYGQTALHWASRHYTVDCARALLGRSGRYDINRQDAVDQLTPLHTAITTTSVEHVHLLLAAGADPGVFDGYGRPAPHYCMYYDCPEALVTILNARPDAANTRDSDGRTPIHFACGRHGMGRCVKTLLSAPQVDVDAPDKWLRTPLHACALGGSNEAAKQLLRAGARTTATDIRGRTAAQYALQYGNAELFKLITHAAAKQGHIDADEVAMQLQQAQEEPGVRGAGRARADSDHFGPSPQLGAPPEQPQPAGGAPPAPAKSSACSVM